MTLSPAQQLRDTEAECIGHLRAFWSRLHTLMTDLAATETRSDEAARYAAEARAASAALADLDALEVTP